MAVTDGLVGREHELELTDALLGRLQNGEGATLVIEGEAGIGKTRLVHSLIERAQDAGLAVFHGGAHPLEQTRPFGAVAEALDLRRRSPDPRRAAIGRLLVGEGVGATAGAGSADMRYRIVDEVIDLVETACADVPALFVVEDLHWADSSTLLAVRALAEGLGHVPLLVVGTLRPSPRGPELDQLLDDVYGTGATSVRLQPLSDEDVGALVRSELGSSPGPSLVSVVAKAGGNPLWVVEILRSLSAEGWLEHGSGTAEVTESELPDSLRELVVRRLRYLPEPTLALLQITAVLGDTVSIHDLAAVARRPAVEVVGELGEAFRARLLGEQADAVVFRHQVVHDAIYQNTPRPIRRALHRDAAGELARAGADLSQVASHLVLGARRGDLEAVRWLREAAGDAAAGAPSVAVDLLRRAEALLPKGHSDADLIAVELVEALLLAGKVADAATLAEAVLAREHRAEVDVPLRLALTSALSLQNRPLELIERAEATLEQAPTLSPAQQSLLLAQASYGRTFSGDIVGAESSARRALALAEEADDAAMRVWSLTTLSVAVKTQGRYDEALMLTRQAVGLAFDPPNLEARLRHPQFFLGLALSDSDLMDDARLTFRAALDECEELGSAWILADALLMSAEVDFLTGGWDDAMTEIDAGLRVAEEHGNRILIGQSRGYQALMWAGRGDHRRAATALAGLDPVVDDLRPFAADVVTFASAVLAEAEGRPVEAHGLLLDAWQADAALENRYYHRHLAPPLTRLSVALGHEALARDVAALAEQSSAMAPEVPSVAAVGARCRGLVTRDPELMLEALGHARRSPRLIDHGGACEDAAVVLVEAGRAAEAKEVLAEALDQYEGAGADAWAARVGTTLRGLGVRVSARGAGPRPLTGWESLTPTERAVSELVAEGLTNREVAKRLYVSPHTINTHLRHVFQKLSISTRAALAAQVARQVEPAR